MQKFRGQTIAYELRDGVLELALGRAPCNEIGSESLAELEQFVDRLPHLQASAHALILYSTLPCGFSAGADLRELYRRSQELGPERALSGIRNFLERIHQVMNILDGCPLVTIAALHGVVFGGGFELALTADLMVADKTARFCFPELRLGLIPGFGGIPRLKRDLGNAIIRDLVLTGRSFNAQKAQQIGLVSQLVAEGEALRAARRTAEQVGKFDANTRARAKQFTKPIPQEELDREIELFCQLFAEPAVERGLKKFAESEERQPYLP